MKTTSGGPEVDIARSSFYRVLSLFLLPPAEGVRSEIEGRRAAATLAEAADVLGPELRDQVEEALRSFGDSMPGGPEALSERFFRVFGHGLAPDNPPYESFYGQAHLFQQTHAIADVAGFMAAFGLKPSGAMRERADHVGVECEFMAFLAYKEAYARLEGGEADHFDLTRDASKRFLGEHLGRFACSFANRLERGSGDPFYSALAHLLRGIVEWDLEHLGVEGFEEAELLPGALEEDDEDLSCGGCEEILGQSKI